MTLTLNLPQVLEERLTEEAKRQGISPQEYALELLKNRLAPEDRRGGLVQLLQSWMEEADAEEQRETGDYLIRAIDEDRLSARKLFPEELKGVTW